MKITLEKEANYSAQVVTLSTFQAIPGADRIQHAEIFGCKVIVAKALTAGTRGIFFPVECQISPKFLAENNLFGHAEKNVDSKAKGFFEDNGRVRAVRMRGAASEGFFISLENAVVFGQSGTALTGQGKAFDTVDGQWLCRKYIPQGQKRTAAPIGKKGVGPRRESRLIQNQFRLHADTPQLGRNLERIQPDSIIHVSNKVHGSSFVVGNVLTKKRLTWWQKFLNRVGGQVSDQQYGIVFSSRTVVKNQYFDDARNQRVQQSGYYGEDLWGEVAKQIGPKLPEGYTVYGEVFGYTSGGKAIQKGYAYGCRPGTWAT